MKKILLVYTSITAFTKQYVEWIAQDVPCDAIELHNLKQTDLNQYSIIVYGAGIHAGKVRNLKRFKKKTRKLVDKEFVVFATGGAPFTTNIYQTILKNNFSETETHKYPFFYFQSGLNYERMLVFDRIVMKSYGFLLKWKKNKSKTENETKNTITQSYNYSRKEYTVSLVETLKKMQTSMS